MQDDPEPFSFKTKLCALAAVEDNGKALNAHVVAVLKAEPKDPKNVSQLKDTIANILKEAIRNEDPAFDRSDGSTSTVAEGDDSALFERVGDEVDNNLQTCPVCKDYQVDPLDGELYEDTLDDPRVDSTKSVTTVHEKILNECEQVREIYGLKYSERFTVIHEMVEDGPYRFHFVCMSEEKRNNLTEALKRQPDIGRVVDSLSESSMFIYDPEEAENISKPDQFKLILAALVGRLIRPTKFLEDSLEKKKLLKAHELCENARPPTDFFRMVEFVSVYTLSIINTGEYQFPLQGRNIIMCMPDHTHRFIFDFLSLQGASVCYYQPGEFIKNNTIHMAIFNVLADCPSAPILRKLHILAFMQFIANNCKKYYVDSRLYPEGPAERKRIKAAEDKKFNQMIEAMNLEERIDQEMFAPKAENWKNSKNKRKGKQAGKKPAKK